MEAEELTLSIHEQAVRDAGKIMALTELCEDLEELDQKSFSLRELQTRLRLAHKQYTVRYGESFSNFDT